MRLLFITILCVAFGCSNTKKEDTSSPVKDAEKIESSQPEGVVILPQSEADTLKGSIKAYVRAKVGEANISINYYSPAVRNRMIWGGLVAYNNVWVTGAHKATNIEFDKDVIFGDSKVAKGKYAVFTIPGNNEWTFIINSNWNQHLADDYKEAEDIARLSVMPITNATYQERLRYIIKPLDSGTGELVMQWEKIELRVPFSLVD